MPRKPWVKLSTGIIASTTWKATTTLGIREFLALMVLADENGIVDAVNVNQLCMTVYYNSSARCMQKVDKALTLLMQIGSIMRNADGTISLPKYQEYQYFVDSRPNSKYRRITPPLPQRRADKDKEQIKSNKTSVNNADFETWYAAYPVKKDRKAAEKAYARAIAKISPSELLEYLGKQIKEWNSNPPFPGYCPPYPATWLNGERWTDTPGGNFGKASAGGFGSKPNQSPARARGKDWSQLGRGQPDSPSTTSGETAKRPLLDPDRDGDIGLVEVPL